MDKKRFVKKSPSYGYSGGSGNKINKPEITIKEARIILQDVNTEKMKIKLEDFKIGLEVELEHGLMFKPYNVTNNHPLLTGKIVMAHFMEMLDYYKRLEVAEIEGDIHKAFVTKNMEKIRKYTKKLIQTRIELGKSEKAQLQ